MADPLAPGTAGPAQRPLRVALAVLTGGGASGGFAKYLRCLVPRFFDRRCGDLVGLGLARAGRVGLNQIEIGSLCHGRLRVRCHACVLPHRACHYGPTLTRLPRRLMIGLLEQHLVQEIQGLAQVTLRCVDLCESHRRGKTQPAEKFLERSSNRRFLGE